MAANSDVELAWRVVEGLRAAVGLVARKRSTASAGSEAQSTEPLGEVANSTPSVFVSWAHRDPGWHGEQELAWQTQVAKLVFTLRQRGVDADIDLFYLENATIDWTRFGPQKVAEADTVLIVMSRGWADRWEGSNQPTVGAGAVAEADQLHGLFSRDQAEWQRKCLIVMLPDVDPVVLPDGLARANRFSVDPYDLDSYEPLLRTLTAQPSFEKPALGDVPLLPPRSVSGPAATEVDAWVRVAKQERRAHTRERAGGVSAAEGDALTNREALLQALVDAMREAQP